MRLDRAACTEIRWAVTITTADGAPVDPDTLTAPPEVWLAEAWQTAALDDGDVVLLCAGPDAEAPPEDAVVLAAGHYWPRVRLVDNPEALVDDLGVIVVA